MKLKRKLSPRIIKLELCKGKFSHHKVYSDGNVKEFSNRSDALISKSENDKEASQILHKGNKTKSISDLIYEDEVSTEDMDDSDINKLDTTNIKHKYQPGRPSILIKETCSKKFGVKFNTIADQLDEEYIKRLDFMRKVYNVVIKSKFITGGPKIEGNDEMMPSDSDEEEMAENNRHRKMKLGEAAEDSGEEEDDKFLKPHMKNQPTKEELIKLQKREEFIDENYGYFKEGTYVRVEVEIEKKLACIMEPEKVVTLCAIEKREEQFGYMRVKIKKHRWYPHILKNKDPLIFSIGWRRFQSVPVFTTEDQNERTRMLKYTPKFGFCYGVFYGPLYPLTTSFICIQRLDDKASHFRIAANGVIIEQNQNFRVMKKLKLIGEPYKIHKNTAFIKKMFSSSLEVSRYEGAKLQTVSGIRGQIKKAVATGVQDGCFRATFEDKLKKSDIIFCKTWYQVDIPKFYNPLYSYGNTRLLKITSEIRKDKDIDLKFPKDSQYIMREEEEKLKQLRDERVSMPLHVPKHISSNLPFKAKMKVNKMNDREGENKRRRTNLLQKLNLPSKRPFKAQFMNENDKKIYSLVQRLGTIDKQKYQENKKRVDKLEAKKKEEDEFRQEMAKKARQRRQAEKNKRRRR